jgi:hypothetical protein
MDVLPCSTRLFLSVKSTRVSLATSAGSKVGLWCPTSLEQLMQYLLLYFCTIDPRQCVHMFSLFSDMILV